jgi:1-acyl-sn-glycerol-3-phosphate acyltransferase
MLYHILRTVGRFIFGLLGLRVEGAEQLPASGPVIVASNHVSNWDPVVVALALNRPVHFMGKVQLFKYWPLAKLFRSLHAFPVRKDIPDRKSIRQALQVLAENQVLGIFPEGRRNKAGHMLAEPGIILIARRSGAPIVPVACTGTNANIPWGWGGNIKQKIWRNRASSLWIKSKGSWINEAGFNCEAGNTCQQ